MTYRRQRRAPHGSRARASALAILLPAMLSLAGGCRCRQGAPAPQRQPLGATPDPAGRVLRSLIKEAPRGELWRRGLLVDFGTADQHKYTLGGWPWGWGESRRQGQRTFVDMYNRGQVRFHDWQGGIAEITLVMRTDVPRQRLTLLVDGAPGETLEVPKQWGTLRLPLKTATSPGRRTVEFRFSERPAGRVLALLDRAAFCAASAKKIRWNKLAPGPGGTPYQALEAGPPTTHSFYLLVPRRTSLVFSHMASLPVTFTITAAVDGEEATEPLFKARAGDGKWRQGRVSLDRLGGKLARLDLSTSGPMAEAAWSGLRLVSETAPPPAPAMSKDKLAKNVIHVLVDTVRQDEYRPFNSRSRLKAPALEALASNGVTFLNAYTNANWTLPSVASFLSGRYHATFMSSYHDGKVPGSILLLPQYLRQRGFTTAAITANDQICEAYGLARGWDFLRNLPKEGRSSDAKAVFGEALAWLDRRADKDKRFYLYVHTMDPHTPYYCHDKYTDPAASAKRGRIKCDGFRGDYFKQIDISEFTPDELRFIRALYRGEVAFHDHHFTGFVKALKRRGLMDNTLVVYSNDHGEEFLEHEMFFHDHTLYEELIRCPLVIHYPPLFPPGKEVTTPVELVDLFPTLLQGLGLPRPAGLHGESLLEVVAGRPGPAAGIVLAEGAHRPAEFILSQTERSLCARTTYHHGPGKERLLDDNHRVPGRALRMGSYKLIVRPGCDELFHLARDPTEKKNVAARHPVAHRVCEVYLGEALGVPEKGRRLEHGAVPRSDIKREKAVIDEKLRRRLKALGYIK